MSIGVGSTSPFVDRVEQVNLGTPVTRRPFVEAPNCNMFEAPKAQTSSAKTLVPDARLGSSEVFVSVDRLRVRVLKDADGMDVRGDFDKLQWNRFTAIGNGVRRTVAAVLSLKPEEVCFECGLHVAKDSPEAIARVCISMPERHELKGRLSSSEVMAAVEQYQEVLAGGRRLSSLLPPLLAPPEASGCETASIPGSTLLLGSDGTSASSPGTKTPWDAATEAEPRGLLPATNPATPPEMTTKAHELAQQLHDIARETAAIVGGCTLKLPCVVSSESWGSTVYSLSGKLARKPKLQAAAVIEEPPEVDCRIRGYDLDARIAYLKPITSGSARIVVAYDEAIHLPTLREAAQPDAPPYRVSYTESTRGTEVSRALKSLTLVPTDEAKCTEVPSS